MAPGALGIPGIPGIPGAPRVGAAVAAVARLRREAGPPDAVRAVVRENRLSSGLDADDVRLIFAQRVADTLEGGRAAILTPDNRKRALRMARLLGMRPFDASLIVAVVQDSARTGAPMGLLARDARLALVAPADPSRPLARRRLFLSARLVGVMVVAGTVFGALVSWALR